MFDASEEDLLRRYSQQDMLASLLRLCLSTLGPMGTITAEFLTQFVPRQRTDRLLDYVEQLADRFAGLEEQMRERLQTSAAYASLAEQAIVLAVRSASAERRRELADLLRNGLSRPDAELVEYEALLHLLERLNDAQVLILVYHDRFGLASFGSPEPGKFRAKHPGVFDVSPPVSGDSEDNVRRWTMYEHYGSQLLALGLLEEREGLTAGSRDVVISELGRLLLAAVKKGKDDTV